MALRCTPKNIYVNKHVYEGQLLAPASSKLVLGKFMVSVFFFEGHLEKTSLKLDLLFGDLV